MLHYRQLYLRTRTECERQLVAVVQLFAGKHTAFITSQGQRVRHFDGVGDKLAGGFAGIRFKTRPHAEEHREAMRLEAMRLEASAAGTCASPTTARGITPRDRDGRFAAFSG